MILKLSQLHSKQEGKVRYKNFPQRTRNVYPSAGHRGNKCKGEVFMFRPGHSLAHLRWESEPGGEFGLSLPNNRANIALLYEEEEEGSHRK